MHTAAPTRVAGPGVGSVRLVPAPWARLRRMPGFCYMACLNTAMFSGPETEILIDNVFLIHYPFREKSVSPPRLGSPTSLSIKAVLKTVRFILE